MYSLSEFSNEFQVPYNLVNMNGQVYKLRKLNKTQETMLYNSFEEIANDVTLFVPTMYALLVGTKDENLILFEKSFGKEVAYYKTTETEHSKTLELIAAKNLFTFISREGGIIAGSFSEVLKSSLKSVLEDVDNGGTRLYLPFISVLKKMGYTFDTINKLSGAELVRVSFKEVIFSGNCNLLVYLADRAYKQNEELDVPRFFKLFLEFNDSEGAGLVEEIQKYIAIYKSPINVFGELRENTTAPKDNGFKKGVVVIDGQEVDLEDREKTLKFMGV